jgi:Ni,Fe-hydrogenase III component G
VRADVPGEGRLFVYADLSVVKAVCRHLFRELDARYVVSIGADDRPYSGQFMVAHNFAFDRDHLLVSVLAMLPAEAPRIESISDVVPAANWAEREFRDLVGIEPVGHQHPRRLILPDGWPEGVHPLRKEVAWNLSPEEAVAVRPPPRAEYIRTIMLELERLHSHLLWVGLAGHIVGFDTLFMQSFRIREPVMWLAEKISGNRKTYSLCVIGGVRWDITPELKAEFVGVLARLEAEWRAVVAAVQRDRNLQARTRGVGVADRALAKEMGLLGPVARAAGVNLDCRRDHPYAAYARVEFDVITAEGADVWSRVVVRM